MTEFWRYTFEFENEAAREAFEKSLTHLPSGVSETGRDMVIPEVKEPGWAQELHRLRSIIDATRFALTQGNEVSVKGFSKLINPSVIYLNDLNQSRNEKGLTKKDEVNLILSVLQAFEDSYGKYSMNSSRPGKTLFGKTSSFQYLRLEQGIFTPREIRFLVGAYGLDGNVLPQRVLAEQEGMNPGSVSTSLAGLRWSARFILRVKWQNTHPTA